MNCRLCNATIERKTWYDHDIHMEVETYESCPNCGLTDHYSYGYGLIEYGEDGRWGYSYSTTPEEMTAIWKEIEAYANEHNVPHPSDHPHYDTLEEKYL